MKYEIIGDSMPSVICHLEQGETLFSESGAMSWMSPNILMETTSNGGIGKMFGRMFLGESLFLNRYHPENGAGVIAFSSRFPGEIRTFEVDANHSYILQKSAFLAAESGVDISASVNKKFSVGLVGGEGFIMQRASGQGLVFAEFDGHVVEYDLQPGQQIVVGTGYLAAMEDTCNIEIRSVKGVKNVLFGGEGFFNTVITGPGEVWLQTMPIAKIADAIIPYLPTPAPSND